MDHTKTCRIRWKEITTENFTSYLSPYHNGFAVLTGHHAFVIDFDQKHNPPIAIYESLMNACHAVEQTPGGYHFWFLMDGRTSHFTSSTDVCWDNLSIKGLDIRAKGGICYTAPSSYKVGEETKTYQWIKGNLSTAITLSAELLEHLTRSIVSHDAFSFTLTKKVTASLPSISL